MTGALVVVAAFLFVTAAIVVLAFGWWGVTLVVVAGAVSAVALKHLDRGQPL